MSQNPNQGMTTTSPATAPVAAPTPAQPGAPGVSAQPATNIAAGSTSGPTGAAPTGLPTAYGMVVWPSLPGLQQAAVGVAPPIVGAPGVAMGRGLGSMAPGRGGIPRGGAASPASSPTSTGGLGVNTDDDSSGKIKRKPRVTKKDEAKVRTASCPAKPGVGLHDHTVFNPVRSRNLGHLLLPTGSHFASLKSTHLLVHVRKVMGAFAFHVRASRAGWGGRSTLR